MPPRAESLLPPVASNTTRARGDGAQAFEHLSKPGLIVGGGEPALWSEGKVQLGFFETSMPTKTCVLVIMSSLVAQPCMIRAQRPTQLFGLGQEGHDDPGCQRSQWTSVASVYHAPVECVTLLHGIT